MRVLSAHNLIRPQARRELAEARSAASSAMAEDAKVLQRVWRSWQSLPWHLLRICLPLRVPLHAACAVGTALVRTDMRLLFFVVPLWAPQCLELENRLTLAEHNTRLSGGPPSPARPGAGGLGLGSPLGESTRAVVAESVAQELEAAMRRATGAEANVSDLLQRLATERKRSAQYHEELMAARAALERSRLSGTAATATASALDFGARAQGTPPPPPAAAASMPQLRSGKPPSADSGAQPGLEEALAHRARDIVRLETALVKARQQTSELQAELNGRQQQPSGDGSGRGGAESTMTPSKGAHHRRSGSKDSRDSGQSGHGVRSALARGADTPSGRGSSSSVAATAAAAAAAAAGGANGPPPVVAAALVEELYSAAADAAKTDPSLAAHLRGIAQALNSIQSLLVAELSAFEQARGDEDDREMMRLLQPTSCDRRLHACDDSIVVRT